MAKHAGPGQVKQLAEKVKKQWGGDESQWAKGVRYAMRTTPSTILSSTPITTLGQRPPGLDHGRQRHPAATISTPIVT
jgi:hypothetical protein